MTNWQELQKKVEQAQASQQRAEWERDSLLKELQEKFGCESVEEAEAKLATLEGKLDRLEKKYAKALEEFEEEWSAYENQED